MANIVFFIIHFLFITVIDINECAMNISKCHKNAKCRNTEGSYKCKCRKGFTGDGKSCTGRADTFLYSNTIKYIYSNKNLHEQGNKYEVYLFFHTKNNIMPYVDH